MMFQNKEKQSTISEEGVSQGQALASQCCSQPVPTTKGQFLFSELDPPEKEACKNWLLSVRWDHNEQGERAARRRLGRISTGQKKITNALHSSPTVLHSQYSLLEFYAHTTANILPSMAPDWRKSLTRQSMFSIALVLC